jgi:CheY-like chemotaxis protein
MKVLVVDDEIAIVELITDVLSDEGYEVVSAHDGRSALKLLRSGNHPEVVITDLMMPNLDGMGLYHAIRSEFPDQPIGVLLMSAGRRQIELDDSHAAFMPKPFSVEDMLVAIERLAE